MNQMVRKIPIGKPADQGSRCNVRGCKHAGEAKCQCGETFCAYHWWRHNHAGIVFPDRVQR